MHLASPNDKDSDCSTLFYLKIVTSRSTRPAELPSSIEKEVGDNEVRSTKIDSYPLDGE